MFYDSIVMTFTHPIRALCGISICLLCIPVFAPTRTLAQDSTLSDLAKADVQRLSSTDMMGRGYTRNGHRIAADYIRKRFRLVGLDSLHGSYYQTFYVSIDTFTSRPTLIISDLPLNFGNDFVVNPGTTVGTHKNLDVVHSTFVERLTLYVDSLDKEDIRDKIVILDTKIPDRKDSTSLKTLQPFHERLKYLVSAKAAGVIRLVDRPVHGNFMKKWQVPIFEVQREKVLPEVQHVSFSIDRTFDASVETQNVVGLLPGTGETDSLLIICGHYDHLGAITDSLFFPGANDNASGIALMLALAEEFKEKPLRYDVLFIAFSGEEIGLRGSHFFVENPLIDLDRVRFLINLDMAASGLDGIMALGGIDFPEEFELLKSVHDSLELPELRKRENSPNSDHWYFLQEGIRGFYIYPFTGHQPYHHIDDTVETLQWETFERMLKLVKGFVRKL